MDIDSGADHGPVLGLQEVLRLLAEADSGRLRPDLRDGRYAAVVHDQDGDLLDDDLDDADLDDTDLDDTGPGDDAPEDGEPLCARVIGEATSIAAALDLLAGEVTSFDAGEPEEMLEEMEEEYEDEMPQVVGEIRSPGRRLLALVLAGYAGPLNIVTDRGWRDHYLGRAPLLFPGARFVFLASAAPPHHEEAYAVLELQPVGTPSPADRSLMEAGDAAAVEAALTGGANVDALDERGMSPLHHAVAHRRPDVVAALLAAGADPARQAAFGNAPHFATLGAARTAGAGARRVEDGIVAAGARRVEGAAHWAILRALVEAGAPVNAGDLTGATLLDLAIATRPYPEEAIGFLTGRGARTAHRASEPLAELLRRLPYSSAEALEIRVNEVRFLLDSGAGTGGALHALLECTGYYEHEVPGEILVALVDEILRHGARDTPDGRGRTALTMAESWVSRGNHPNYEPVVERLRT
ncbi:hypothetical protein [Nonomuraea sp. NPDC050691]|uniref:hypothetical protein n=1 Tax=Nonomuraea sp. NPDC050691 TaxID=3155661 RepID=UPI0033CD4A68